MLNEAAEIPVLVPLQEDGRPAGGRRRSDVLALLLVGDQDRSSLLAATAAAGLVVAEASTLAQAVSLVSKVVFDVVLAPAEAVEALSSAIAEALPEVNRPVVVSAASFLAPTSTPESDESLHLATREETDLALRELAALCDFTRSPLTVALVALDDTTPGLDSFVLQRLLASVRAGDVVGPWSPGIVAVGLGEAGREDAALVVHRLRADVSSSPAVLDGVVTYATVAVGSASGSPDLSALLAQAEQALASARLSGPGRAFLLP